jgi:hypothetical protein
VTLSSASARSSSAASGARSINWQLPWKTLIPRQLFSKESSNSAYPYSLVALEIMTGMETCSLSFFDWCCAFKKNRVFNRHKLKKECKTCKHLS